MTGVYNVMVGATSYNYGEYIFGKVQKEIRKQESGGRMLKGDTDSTRRKAEKLLREGESLMALNLVHGDEVHIDGTSIYSGHNTQVLPYLTVHPLYLDKALNLLDRNTVIYVADRDYGTYLEAYYGRKTVFIPMCGLVSSKKKAWKDRNIELFFSGSYLDEEATEKQMEKEIPEKLLPLCRKIIAGLEKDMVSGIDSIVIQELQKTGVPFTGDTVKEFLTEYGELLLEYVNRFNRSKIIRALLELGLTVTVTGIHWQVFKNKLPQAIQKNLQIVTDNMNYRSVVDFMQDSKIVLNVSSGLRNGIHERVATAMLNGAVCFTEENAYTKEKLKNHANIELYRYSDVKKMVRRIREILQDEEMGSRISSEAVRFAKEEFSPECFAAKLICEAGKHECMQNEDFQRGIQLFEQGAYEQALLSWIRSYEAGLYRKEILEIILANFVQPNLQELEQTYLRNRENITSIEFQDIPILLIPVSDERFYLFDMEKGVFNGMFDMTADDHVEKEMEFHSMLITDCWDFREMVGYVGNRYPSCVYVLPSDERRFAVFLQIPGFVEKHLTNYVIFNSEEIMRLYFQEYDNIYLPRLFVSKDVSYYKKIFEDIHIHRIQNCEAERKNVFLSICIPSFNRGGEALRAVRRLLELPYDSEIEIIVSDNGSTKALEGYDEISKIKDSRIVYYKAPKSMNYVGNIYNVLKMARGKYAVLQSDEDLMVVENLQKYLNILVQYNNLGFVLGNGLGSNFPKITWEGSVGDRISGILLALDRNYLTGNILNTEKLRCEGAFEIFESLKDNRYVFYYTHIFFILCAMKDADMLVSKEVLYLEGEESKTSQSAGMFQFIQPESRVEQYRAIIEVVTAIYQLDEEEMIKLITERLERVYHLVNVGFYHYRKDYERDGVNWKELCDRVRQSAFEVLQDFLKQLSKENACEVRETCERIYKEYLVRAR